MSWWDRESVGKKQWETRSENWTDFEEREVKINFLVSAEPSSKNAP